MRSQTHGTPMNDKANLAMELARRIVELLDESGASQIEQITALKVAHELTQLASASFTGQDES